MKTLSIKWSARLFLLILGLVSASTYSAEAPTQVFVKGGSFSFGCSPQDTLCDVDEGPQGGVRVKVPEFFIDAQETSVAEYRQCVEDGACKRPFDYKRTHYCNYDAPGRDNYPVNCVNWHMAFTYCTWRQARLAYEVEWEMAARAGTDTPYPWGHEPADCDKAVVDPGVPGEADTETDGCWRDLSWPRGSFQPNPFGLYDTIGGTSEWVMDWYDPATHSRHHRLGQLTGPRRGTRKVIKGGSWDEKHQAQRVSNRFAKPVTGNPDLYGSNGIRCVTVTPGSLSPESPGITQIRLDDQTALNRTTYVV